MTKKNFIGDVEFQEPWVGRRNFELNSTTVLRDAYRLLCVLLADKRLVEERVGDDDSLLLLRNRFIEDEVIHTLIGIAVLNRGQEEHMRGLRDAAEMSFQPIEMSCGCLKTDVANNDPDVELGFREACNKIIHAVQISVEPERGAGGSTYVPLVLTLRGNQRAKAWEATLDIKNFLRATISNFES